MNATPLDITVTVNGIDVGPLPTFELSLMTITAPLPALPWSVEAQTPSGRVVAVLPVPTDYADGTYVRSDLSCGAVVLWVGRAPVHGPAPPAPGQTLGTPGDCDP